MKNLSDYGDFWGKGDEVLWEDDKGWFIITDRYLDGKGPTATLWHACAKPREGDEQRLRAHSNHNPEEDIECWYCKAPLDAVVSGFFKLVRYGQENK